LIKVVGTASHAFRGLQEYVLKLITHRNALGGPFKRKVEEGGKSPGGRSAGYDGELPDVVEAREDPSLLRKGG